MKNLTKIVISAILLVATVLSVASCSMFKPGEEEFYIDGPAAVNMQVGEMISLELVKPDSLKGKVEWTADDDIVVVVDGVILAKAEGITVVHATLDEYSDKVIVTVGTPKPGTGNNNSGNNNTGNNTGNNNTGNNNTGNNGGNTGNNGGNTGNNGGSTGNNGGSTNVGVIGTLDFSSNAQRTSLSGSSQVWQNGNVKLTNNQAASINPVADYVAPVRFYPASDVIIECNGMTKIVLVCDNKYKDSTGSLSTAAEAAGANVTADGDILTITFASPVNSFTFSAIPSQARLSSLEVYGN